MVGGGKPKASAAGTRRAAGTSPALPPVDGAKVARVVAPVAVIALAVAVAVFSLTANSGGGGGAASLGADTASGVQAAVQWGTLRPNVYFGVRARTPKSPLIGLM